MVDLLAQIVRFFARPRDAQSVTDIPVVFRRESVRVPELSVRSTGRRETSELPRRGRETRELDPLDLEFLGENP